MSRIPFFALFAVNTSAKITNRTIDEGFNTIFTCYHTRFAHLPKKRLMPFFSVYVCVLGVSDAVSTFTFYDAVTIKF